MCDSYLVYFVYILYGKYIMCDSYLVHFFNIL